MLGSRPLLQEFLGVYRLKSEKWTSGIIVHDEIHDLQLKAEYEKLVKLQDISKYSKVYSKWIQTS